MPSNLFRWYCIPRQFIFYEACTFKMSAAQHYMLSIHLVLEFWWWPILVWETEFCPCLSSEIRIPIKSLLLLQFGLHWTRPYRMLCAIEDFGNRCKVMPLLSSQVALHKTHFRLIFGIGKTINKHNPKHKRFSLRHEVLTICNLIKVCNVIKFINYKLQVVHDLKKVYFLISCM